jgi:hypothetical protein
VCIRCVNIFTEPLPGDVRGIHIQTDIYERLMKYTVETGSGAMMYIPDFVKIGSCVQKSTGGRRIHRQHADLISLVLYSSK